MVDVCHFFISKLYATESLTHAHTYRKYLYEADNVLSRVTRIVFVICYQSRTVHVINHCVTQILPCAIQYNSRVLIGIAYIHMDLMAMHYVIESNRIYNKNICRACQSFDALEESLECSWNIFPSNIAWSSHQSLMLSWPCMLFLCMPAKANVRRLSWEILNCY